MGGGGGKEMDSSSSSMSGFDGLGEEEGGVRCTPSFDVLG